MLKQVLVIPRRMLIDLFPWFLSEFLLLMFIKKTTDLIVYHLFHPEVPICFEC